MQTSDIKRRIRSVKSTQQITRAMKFVAAAKLRRAQEAMLAMRPYAERVDSILRHLANDLYGDEHPLFRDAGPEKCVATIVIAGDRGLCGGFNANILRTAREHVRSKADAEHFFFTVGKRATAGFRKAALGRDRLVKSYSDVFDKLSFALATEICDLCVARMDRRAAQPFDAVYLVYNEFVSAMAQKPVVKRILPFDLAAVRRECALEPTPSSGGAAPGAFRRPSYEIEPDAETTLERLMTRRIAVDVHRGALESYAAELSARMTAMDSATGNAEDMIGNLTLLYNRARQSGITSELIDIVGGANAQA